MFIINLNLLVLPLENLNNLALIDYRMAMTALLYFSSPITGWILLAGCISAFRNACSELLHAGDFYSKSITYIADKFTASCFRDDGL